METITDTTSRPTAWNKGKLIGQKAPLKLKEIWASRIRLQLESRTRELAFSSRPAKVKCETCRHYRR